MAPSHEKYRSVYRDLRMRQAHGLDPASDGVGLFSVWHRSDAHAANSPSTTLRLDHPYVTEVRRAQALGQALCIRRI